MATATVLYPEIREKAIISHGDECKPKSLELLEAYDLPSGLLPLEDIIEGGWVEETGFVWMLTKKKQEYHFKKADRHCVYDELITCYMEKKKMKEITGVKAKDLLVWVPVNEISVDDETPQNIKFRSIAGISRTFLAELFNKE